VESRIRGATDITLLVLSKGNCCTKRGWTGKILSIIKSAGKQEKILSFSTESFEKKKKTKKSERKSKAPRECKSPLDLIVQESCGEDWAAGKVRCGSLQIP